MADRAISIRELRRIVRRYGGWEDRSLGTGSHTTFLRRIGNGVFSYPVPTHDKDVARVYIVGLRRRLKLTEADGIPDREFYG